MTPEVFDPATLCMAPADLFQAPMPVLPDMALPSPGDLRGLGFELPRTLEAREPPEARGLARDQVRMMVSYRETGNLVHAHFLDLPRFLDAGDLLVINTSGTLNAALAAARADGQQLELHLSTHLPGGLWAVELREPGEQGTLPFERVEAGEVIRLPGGASAALVAPYISNGPGGNGPVLPARRLRLWLATLRTPLPIGDYLARYGSPIHYGYVRQTWPIEYYQTVYVTEAGSAEMPSAGRPFSEAVIARLVAKGVWIAPLILHTGVASLEEDERPYAEFYRVPGDTAHLINAARRRGRRVIAVGTTVVRAVETVTDRDGVTHPGEGWTDLVITPDYRLAAISAMVTGLHQPRSTHLAMLEALAGRAHLRRVYSEALRSDYLWHEFGDVHLILP